MRNYISPARWDELREEYNRTSISMRAMSRKYGFSPNTIIARAGRHGWTKSGHIHHRDSDWLIYRALYESRGVSLKLLANLVGIEPACMVNRAETEGWSHVGPEFSKPTPDRKAKKVPMNRVGYTTKSGRRFRPIGEWEEIRRAYQEGGVGLRELARRLGMNQGTLCVRAQREKWIGPTRKTPESTTRFFQLCGAASMLKSKT